MSSSPKIGWHEASLTLPDPSLASPSQNHFLLFGAILPAWTCWYTNYSVNKFLCLIRLPQTHSKPSIINSNSYISTHFEEGNLLVTSIFVISYILDVGVGWEPRDEHFQVSKPYCTITYVFCISYIVLYYVCIVIYVCIVVCAFGGWIGMNY